MSEAVLERLRALSELTIPAGAGAVYVALCETGEVKVGCAVDVAHRLRSVRRELGLVDRPTLIGILPGYRDLESDLHAALRVDGSRPDGGPLAAELFAPTERVLALVERVRAHVYDPDELGRAIVVAEPTRLVFDDGQVLLIDQPRLRVRSEADFRPRFDLMRECRLCKTDRPCLDFLGRYEVRPYLCNRRLVNYVMLHDGDDGACCHCRPDRLVIPAFALGPPLHLRVATILDRHEQQIDAYDRSRRRWIPMIDVGVRRMTKGQPELRFQPRDHGRHQRPVSA